MLPEKIMHECIKVLLKDQENPSEYDIESLCKLIKTIGKILDSAEAKIKSMDQYFGIMQSMSNNNKLPSRLRFMLKVLVMIGLVQ
jgi:translation initiation factor 4G